jgi:putative phosphoesterase
MTASRGESILLLADTHGHLDERVAALAKGVDRIVHAGDIGGASLLERLGCAGAPVNAVVGNNDTARHWAGDAPGRAEQLPGEVWIALPGGYLVAVHGHRVRARVRHARLRRAYPSAAAVVYGHSHRLCIDQDTQPWLLNPGAAGRSRTYGGPSCLLLYAAAGHWSVESRRFSAARC